MENEKKEQKKIWSRLFVSGQVIGSDLDTLNSQLKEVVDEADNVAPGGSFISFIFGNRENFSPIAKAIVSIGSIRSIYSEQSFMREPALAKEFAEVMDHLKEINRIVTKRKNANFKKREDRKSARDQESKA